MRGITANPLDISTSQPGPTQPSVPSGSPAGRVITSTGPSLINVAADTPVARLPASRRRASAAPRIDPADPGQLSLPTILGQCLLSTVAYNYNVSTMSTESTSKRRPSPLPNIGSPPGVNTDPVRGAAEPEVASIYDGLLGQSSSTGRSCRGSHRTSGNQGDASSVTEPAVTSGASSLDAVPAVPGVEYSGTGSWGPARPRSRGSSSFLATQQPPATVACSSEQVPAALKSELTRIAGTCTSPGGVADYSALPGLSSLQRAARPF